VIIKKIKRIFSTINEISPLFLSKFISRNEKVGFSCVCFEELKFIPSWLLILITLFGINTNQRLKERKKPRQVRKTSSKKLKLKGMASKKE